MRVLVVDDHAIVRQGLVALLATLGGTVAVIEAAGAADALVAMQNHPKLDVAIVDLFLPDGGAPLISEISRLRSELPIIVLSASEDPDHVQKAIQSGALGYVPKSANASTLLSAIRMVLGGDMYLPPFLLQSTGEPNAQDMRLTPRQLEILQYLASGLSNKAIAGALKISEKTVKSHLGAVYRDMNVINRAQAIEKARQIGLID